MVYIYLRTSRSEPDPAPHFTSASRFCRAREMGEVGEVFRDLPESIDVPWFDRPAGRELVARLRPGDTVIIPCGSMVWTSAGELAGALARVFAAGAGVAFVGSDLVLTPADAEAVAKALEVYALLKFNTHSEGTRAGMAARKRQGLRWCHRPPVGVKWVGRKGRQRLVPDPDDAELAARVRAWREAGHTWLSIVYHLAEKGVRRRDGRPWRMDALKRLLGVKRGAGTTTSSADSPAESCDLRGSVLGSGRAEPVS